MDVKHWWAESHGDWYFSEGGGGVRPQNIFKDFTEKCFRRSENISFLVDTSRWLRPLWSSVRSREDLLYSSKMLILVKGLRTFFFFKWPFIYRAACPFITVPYKPVSDDGDLFSLRLRTNSTTFSCEKIRDISVFLK